MSTQQIRDLYAHIARALRRHWKLSAAVTGGVAFVALVGALLLPKSYYSEARLFVRFGRENNVDPTASGGQMISIYESRESEINSLIEILKSRPILDRVVAELGPEYILQGKEKAVNAAKPAPSAAFAERGGKPGEPPPRGHQLAVQRLEREVSVWTPRKTNIISVACKADSPDVAQRIVAKLVEVYMTEHVRVHHTPGSYQFFVDQTALSKKEWQAAAGKLREIKNRLAIVTIDGKRRELEAQIGDIASKLLANESELKTAEAKIASLRQLIADLPATIVSQKVEGPNAAFDGMRQTLYQTEAREQELASRMQETHPQLVAIRQQVKDLRAILEEQPEQRLQSTEAANPARQSLELSLLNEQSLADSLQGRGRKLVALREQLQNDLRRVNSNEMEVNQLQQGVELAETRHREYAQKLEQARMNRSLDEDRISSLSLVQPASYVAQSTGPRRIYVLALGVMVALLSGLGTAVALAYLNPALVGMDELQKVLDLPLVGMVPRDTFQPALAS